MERKSIPTLYEIQAKERLRTIINEYCDGSQQRLADKTGVGKASISQYVNGKNIPSNLTAKKLCAPFGINPAWIMGFDVARFTTNENQSPTAKPALTPDETDLLSNYQKLNAAGKSKVREYTADLTEQQKYMLSDAKESPVVESAS